MKYAIILINLLLFLTYSAAEDPFEKSTPTKPLTVWSGGLGAGPFRSINSELEKESLQHLKLTFTNSIYFRDEVALFLDGNWFLPGSRNIGMDFGFDYLFSNSDFRPFMGIGIGAQYLDKQDYDFDNNFGIAATVHLGFLLDLADGLQIRLRVPYHYIANETQDHMIGLDVSFLLSDRWRKIPRLVY